MGKYKYSNDNGTRLTQEILVDIANELAEMNRLKRVQMQNTDGLNVSGIEVDQA